MLTSSFFLTSWVLVTSFLHLVTSCPVGGATPELRKVLTGRCVEFKIKRPALVCTQRPEIDCNQVTEGFVTAFAGQNKCNISRNRYDVFLRSTRHDIPMSKSLFWSGVYQLVHRCSQGGDRLTTLEDTLTGYMVDRLRFCSAANESGGIGGPQTSDCPGFSDTTHCALNAEYSFWSAASINFAKEARGTITIMLNGSREVPFRGNDSFLGRYEMPNLRKGAVTAASIWLVHTPGAPIRSRCNSASIQTLKQVLSDRQITSTCTENPPDVLWLLCWDDPHHPQCQTLLTSGTTPASGTTPTSGVQRILLFVVILYTLLVAFE